MSAFCGWATNVNKIILDSTSITVGENAVYEETLESGGLNRSRLKDSVSVDKFAVVMNFSVNEKDSNGYSEIDRFWRWYKYTHKYGTVPFEFPAILINSNHAAGFSTEDTEYRTDGVLNIPKQEYYRIISAVQGTKSGTDIQVNMTWATYATDVIIIPDEDVIPETVTLVSDRCLKVTLMDFTTLTSQPATNGWGVTIDETVYTPVNSYFDGRAVFLHFQSELPALAGWHEVTVSYDGHTATGEYEYDNGEIVNRTV